MFWVSAPAGSAPSAICLIFHFPFGPCVSSWSSFFRVPAAWQRCNFPPRLVRTLSAQCHHASSLVNRSPTATPLADKTVLLLPHMLPSLLYQTALKSAGVRARSQPKKKVQHFSHRQSCRPNRCVCFLLSTFFAKSKTKWPQKQQQKRQ